MTATLRPSHPLRRPPLLALLAILLALVLVLPYPAWAAPAVGRKMFENWVGEAYHLDNGASFAISRTRENTRTHIELQMVKRVGDCANSSLSVYIIDESADGRRAGKQPIRGQLQVDSLAVHSVEADFFAEPGTTYRALWLRTYDAPRAVMQELASGQSVRLSFTLDQRELTFQFSLRGYGPSYEYIKQLCTAPPPPGQASKPKAPASGGQSAPKAKPKGDADFFTGPSGGTSPSRGSKSDKDYF